MSSTGARSSANTRRATATRSSSVACGRGSSASTFGHDAAYADGTADHVLERLLERHPALGVFGLLAQERTVLGESEDEHAVANLDGTRFVEDGPVRRRARQTRKHVVPVRSDGAEQVIRAGSGGGDRSDTGGSRDVRPFDRDGDGLGRGRWRPWCRRRRFGRSRSDGTGHRYSGLGHGHEQLGELRRGRLG